MTQSYYTPNRKAVLLFFKVLDFETQKIGQDIALLKVQAEEQIVKFTFSPSLYVLSYLKLVKTTYLLWMTSATVLAHRQKRVNLRSTDALEYQQIKILERQRLLPHKGLLCLLYKDRSFLFPKASTKSKEQSRVEKQKLSQSYRLHAKKGIENEVALCCKTN